MLNKKDVEIVLVEQIHSQKIVEYITTSTRSGYDINTFNWQYSDPISYLFMIVHPKSHIIFGTQGMIHLSLKNGDDPIISHKSETTFVDADLRGSGLFEDLYARSINEVVKSKSQLIWGFTALGTLWEKKLGFKCDRTIIYEAMFFTKAPLRSSVIRKIYFGYVAFRNRLKMFSAGGSELFEIEHSEARLLLNQLNGQFPENLIHLDYSSKSFSNRVFNSPKIKYRFANIIERGSDSGIIIFHIHEGQLLISDLIYFGNRDIRSIIKSLFLMTKKTERVYLIRFWGNNDYRGNQAVFVALKEMGAKVELVENMQLVYKDVKSREIRTSDLVINGLWTEGFTY
jgi:hypothetical protein